MSEAPQAQRQTLPINDPQHVGVTTYDAKDPATSFPAIEPLRPPEGAPNVLVILIDDAGFGSSSAFGGPCETPNFERLADKGLRYNRFHTTALCSPTRQALLTGRNHHAVGMGGITEIATSAPGYSSIRPKSAAPLAETLKLNGYSTARFGKCHEVPVWETSPLGPFDAWPKSATSCHWRSDGLPRASTPSGRRLRLIPSGRCRLPRFRRSLARLVGKAALGITAHNRERRLEMTEVLRHAVNLRRLTWIAMAILLFAFGFAIDGASEVGHHAGLILGGIAIGAALTRS